jgi:hypothetical protein
MPDITRARIGYLATLGAGLLIGVAVVGTAHAGSAAPGRAGAAEQPDPARTLAPPPVTHHLSLAASAFAPDSLGNTSHDYSNQWDPSVLSNPGGGRCFNAGLSLPPSVTLKSVKVYFTKGNSNMAFEVNRQDLVNHTSVDLVNIPTPASTGAPHYANATRTIKSSLATVNMTDYAYSVGVCPAGTTTFTGLTITYTEPSG